MPDIESKESLVDKTMTVAGFVARISNMALHRSNIPFCFILGAGASKPSGIKTGEELVDVWLHDLRREEDRSGRTVEEWAQSEVLNPLGLSWKDRARAYTTVFERKYLDFPEDAAAFLESEMSGREPSFGYSVLAHILTSTDNNVVITTNFDNLVADAVQIYTESFPLVVGHESLASFARTHLRRPLICKIHRDLLFSPFNNKLATGRLAGEWRDALKSIFSQYTPIVIGYGGNDGSLMGFLEELQEPPIGGFYWCIVDGTVTDERVKGVVEKLRGRLVTIEGFDELMLRLKAPLRVPDLIPELERRFNSRARSYQRMLEQVTAAIRRASFGGSGTQIAGDLVEAARVAIEEATGSGDWWGWYNRAKAEPNADRRKRIYRDAINACPNSHVLLGSFANFLTDDLGLHDEAEEYYLKALGIMPNCENTNGNYANFLTTIRKKYDLAEKHYRLALTTNPNLGALAYNYGLFLERARHDNAQADEYYSKARALDPHNSEILRVTENFFKKHTRAIKPDSNDRTGMDDVMSKNRAQRVNP